MYNWIETTFNVSGGITQVVAVILALAVVLLLFALFIFILKRLTGVNAPQNRNRQPRIAVMDSAPIDTKRRLVLIRRDNIEHLILVGGPSDVVVEQNIIRNAPLATSRQGALPGMGLAGPGQIKSPMAPGPDIPFRPDERMPEEDPGTLAAQATPVRAPADMADPDPVFEDGPAALPVPETASPAPAPVAQAPIAQATAAPPPVTRAHMPPERTQTAPVSPRPVQSNIAPPATARPLKPEPRIGAGNGSSRAADLLRAATQNGFNRALARTPAVPVAAPDAVAANRKAPEVKTGPTMSGEEAMASADKPAGELSSTSRSFASRERPAYAGHSITPPASGPAARAKTALLKPAETVPQRIEPAVAPQGAGTGSPEPRISTDTSHADAKVEPGPTVLAATLAGISTADATETGSAESDDKVDTGLNENASTASGDLSDVSALAPDPAPDQTQEAAQVLPQADAGISAENPTPERPVQREIVLDLDHLIAGPAPEASKETAPELSTETSAEASAETPAEPVAEVAMSPSESPAPQEPVQAASEEDETSLEAKTGNDEVKPATKPVQGRSDKNPIEEEMAKILDELGGQPN
ncbi:flagellar biosynthetic protein FliO [uncultured Roseibium sp.]|uniref:flagellar biosynthetic protein FliO n=1 Tax=uncultured Roseibium sp. TaxID=1936171 RepID=UPI00260D2129|nr:flagellar biosynthetic protein FliO [uncultured Roseibium sp.]